MKQKLRLTALLAATLATGVFAQTTDSDMAALKNQRVSTGSSLTSANVGQMVLAYQIPTQEPVTHMPLVADGRVYFTDWGGTAYAAETGTGKLVWQTQVQDTVMSQWPWHGLAGTGALGDGMLFEASVEGFAYGIDADTGEVVWTTQVAEDEHAGVLGKLLYHDGRVYLGLQSVEEALDAQVEGFEPNFQGEVMALDAATGDILWERPLVEAPQNGVAVWSSFTLDPDLNLLYFATGNNYTGESSDLSDSMIAVNADTGEIAWSYQVTPNDVWTLGAPVGPDYDFGAGPQLFEAEVDGVARNLVGAGQKSGFYSVFDRATGEHVWSTFVGFPAVGGGIRGEASIGDGRIYVWSNNNYIDGKPPADFPITVKALDAATGETLWYKDRAQPAVGFSAGFLTNDVYFVGSLDGTLQAYGAENGEQLWSETLPSAVGSPLLAADNALFVGAGAPESFGGSPGTSGLFVFAVPVEGVENQQNQQTTAQDQQSQDQQSQAGAEVAAPDPSGIIVPAGYQVEVAAADLSYPGDMAFGPDGAMYIAEVGGHTYGTGPAEAPQARILRINADGSREVAYDQVVSMEAIRQTPFGEAIPEEGLVPPLTGITYNPDNGLLYISHRSRYSTLNPQTGEFKTIIDGLPVWGEFLNHKPVFGPDGKMYFVLSTQGNSGTVDGHMTGVMTIFDKPNAREIPCEDVEVTGADFFLADNPFTDEKGDQVRSEVYVELGRDTQAGEVIPGEFWCHGAAYRANADGTNPERIAWGLRSLYGYAFSPEGRLIGTQNSGNVMEPRPIYNDWETVLAIEEGGWYGWPDYYSGIPITDDRFTRPDDPEFTGNPFPHQFSLTEATRRRLAGDDLAPTQPLVRLPVHAAAEGMVFGRDAFGIPADQILVAEFGAIIPYYKDPESWPGFRVQRVDLETSEVYNFMVNKGEKPAWATGGGGLRRPIQLTYGPDGALYVTDFGVILFDESGMTAEPNTGVVWKVSRTQ